MTKTRLVILVVCILVLSSTKGAAETVIGKTLCNGYSLRAGQAIASENGVYQLTVQGPDGNLVVFMPSINRVVWHAGVPFKGGTVLWMQDNLDAVLKNDSDVLVWHSETNVGSLKDPDACLAVSDSGQPVVYSNQWSQSHNQGAKVQVVPWPNRSNSAVVQKPEGSANKQISDTRVVPPVPSNLPFTTERYFAECLYEIPNRAVGPEYPGNDPHVHERVQADIRRHQATNPGHRVVEARCFVHADGSGPCK